MKSSFTMYQLDYKKVNSNFSIHLGLSDLSFFYVWKIILQTCMSGNGSIDLEQLDFKPAEFQLWQIS